MCGICGVLSRRGGDVDARNARVGKMNSQMIRRGPDDEGIWSDERLSLGFRRLSIIDLSRNGHQPMSTPDGRFHLVFNGEVYNFAEIRAQLIAKGVAFVSRSDTEVVLHSLAMWGKSALTKFNGMFAIAFYDSVEGRLLLARDPIGIKPLYYGVSDQWFVFGSQFDQVLSFRKELGTELCRSGISYYLRLGYIPAPHSVFKQIRMLEAGAFIELDREWKVVTGKYWEFPLEKQPRVKADELIDLVNETIEQAVSRQLVSDVPIGCFLSGGIDSPLIAAMVRKNSSESVKAYTLRVQGADCDESQWAMDYAKAIGVEQIVVDCAASDLLHLVRESVQACHEPLADYSILPTMLVSKAAASSVKVMLSGDGGDELFWGYFGRFSSVLSRCSEFEKPYHLRTIERGLLRLSGKRNPGQHLVQRSIGDWVRAKHTRIFDEDIDDVFVDAPPFDDASGFYSYTGFDQDETANWLRWNEFVAHLSMVLLKVDRASMFSSLEVRVPLLDMNVVEMASRVHWKDCLDIQGGIGKLPLRKCLSRYVPKQSVDKKGFSVPMGDWLRGPLRSLVEDVLLSKQSLLGMNIHRNALRRYFESHCSGRTDRAWGVWVLLSLALWEDRYLGTTA